MKSFLIVIAILLSSIVTESKADTTIRIAPASEVIKSVRVYVVDTGKKACEGLTTTIFGIGEFVSAPFRADTYRPKKKTYYFKSPRIEYQRGFLYSK